MMTINKHILLAILFILLFIGSINAQVLFAFESLNLVSYHF